MNILFIPTQDPRALNGGNEQRTNLLWESLKKLGRVYTFVLDAKLDSKTLYIDGEHPICCLHPQKKGLTFWRVLNSIIWRLSIFCIYARKVISIKKPEEVFQGVHFDVVVTRYVYPLCYYKYWNIAPLLIDIDDYPEQVYETVHKSHLPWGLRTIGKYVTKWQTDYFVKKSSGGWIANKEQVKLLGDNFVFLPNMPQMPSSNYKFDYKERKNLFTVGAMNYGPNKDGVTRFLKQVWPSFHHKHPDVMYFIIGKGAPEDDVKIWNSIDGVKYLGYVANLEELYENILATVVPVYSGGGTCIKTLESMAYSRICLSTLFGARGLPEDVVNDNKCILLFEDAESFINAYDIVLDVKQRKEIEKQGQEVVTSNYSVDGFNKVVREIISKAGRCPMNNI